ncbi:MAG: hypothetical protein WAM11_06775 [Cyanobium sp.]
MPTTAVTATASRASAPPGPTAAALFNGGVVAGSLGHWQKARQFFEAAAEARPGFAMARCSAALAAFQLGELEQAEAELCSLIRRYPLLADPRAALAALLDHRGARSEAAGCLRAAIRLDSRYLQHDWLLQTRRWPPLPLRALRSLLRLGA